MAEPQAQPTAFEILERFDNEVVVDKDLLKLFFLLSDYQLVPHQFIWKCKSLQELLYLLKKFCGDQKEKAACYIYLGLEHLQNKSHRDLRNQLSQHFQAPYEVSISPHRKWQLDKVMLELPRDRHDVCKNNLRDKYIKKLGQNLTLEIIRQWNNMTLLHGILVVEEEGIIKTFEKKDFLNALGLSDDTTVQLTLSGESMLEVETLSGCSLDQDYQEHCFIQSAEGQSYKMFVYELHIDNLDYVNKNPLAAALRAAFNVDGNDHGDKDNLLELCPNQNQANDADCFIFIIFVHNLPQDYTFIELVCEMCYKIKLDEKTKYIHFIQHQRDIPEWSPRNIAQLIRDFRVDDPNVSDFEGDRHFKFKNCLVTSCLDNNLFLNYYLETVKQSFSQILKDSKGFLKGKEYMDFIRQFPSILRVAL